MPDHGQTRPTASQDADKSPFPFSGTAKKVVFDIRPRLTPSDEEALHKELMRSHSARAIQGNPIA